MSEPTETPRTPTPLLIHRCAWLWAYAQRLFPPESKRGLEDHRPHRALLFGALQIFEGMNEEEASAFLREYGDSIATYDPTLVTDTLRDIDSLEEWESPEDSDQ